CGARVRPSTTDAACVRRLRFAPNVGYAALITAIWRKSRGPAGVGTRSLRGYGGAGCDERVHAAADLLLRVRSRQLHADARAALRHDGVRERGHVHALTLHLVGDAAGKRSIPEHDRDDGM